jgi:hypothetical protein
MGEPPRRRVLAIVAVLALSAVAALVLAVLTTGRPGRGGGSSSLARRTSLVSLAASGTRRARIQLAGEESDAEDDGQDEEVEQPPFGEPTELPEPACDIEALQNCLGELQEEERELPEAERALLRGGEDEEVAHEFCEQAKVPFQCACRACDLSKLSTWNNDYWTQDRAAKEIIVKMRKQARCDELHQNGVANFRPGHGCYNLYKTSCEKPLKSDWCPAVLSDKVQDSRYGIAGTMLNDHTKWINPDYVCRGEDSRERERDCKTMFKHSYHDGNKYCGPMHEFIKCMCNSCEHDVESLLTGFQKFGHCDHLARVKDELEQCEEWYQDECESPPGKLYCENVEGSDAWQRRQPPPPPPPTIGWEDDGMQWKKFCDGVVEPMADNPEELDQNLGMGWKNWCIEKYGAKVVEDIPPWGSGRNGHVRLPVSGMPAPRFHDHVDSDPSGKDAIGILPAEGPAWMTPPKDDPSGIHNPANDHKVHHGDMPLRDQVRCYLVSVGLGLCAVLRRSAL